MRRHAQNTLFLVFSLFAVIMLFSCSSVPPQSTANSSDQQLYEEAMAEFEAGHLEEALSLLAHIQEPKDAIIVLNARKLEGYIALYQQALTAYDTGDFTSALQLLNRIVDPTNLKLTENVNSLILAIQQAQAGSGEAHLLGRLHEYLLEKEVTGYLVDESISFNANLTQLF